MTENGSRPRLGFILGAPRSGTTWLARALGADPRVVATYETHLFNAYLSQMCRSWSTHSELLRGEAHRFRVTSEPPRATIGLPYVLSEEEFFHVVGGMVDQIVELAVRSKPQARVLVEKTPSHSSFVQDIERVTGGRARYVHVIRDGYDVVNSLQRAARGWGATWAPGDVPAASRRWAKGVTDARRAACHAERYTEVRYEDLVGNPEREVARVLQFLGVDATAEEAASALTGTDHGLLLAGDALHEFAQAPPEPRGFRKDRASRGLTDRDRVVVNATAGELLAELGYRKDPTAGATRQAVWRGEGRVEGLRGTVTRVVRRVPGKIAALR